jgi:hypothetical protein
MVRVRRVERGGTGHGSMGRGCEGVGEGYGREWGRVTRVSGEGGKDVILDCGGELHKHDLWGEGK